MVVVNESLCDLCGTCAGVCPANCIKILETKVLIDYNQCIECLNCVTICPFEAIRVSGEEVIKV
ncbi:MAG TPA: 4Fe-4S dicluster domain-containing protein [Candidatus Marinimicrobia bacterium]|nr:4Fe-4S dicluster domain-containing protein [Candidatus Neomarinimicrobiota bacterium]